jgi:hypothetical protein
MRRDDRTGLKHEVRVELEKIMKRKSKMCRLCE